MSLKLSIIIPVYNEASTIEAVLERIAEVEIPVEKEVIIVDDGSSDGTRAILERRAAHGAYDWENVQLSPVNFGKGAAIRIGLKHATGDMVLIQDADLELDPGEYPKLLRPMLAGEADVVYGVRDFWRVKGSRMTTRLANFFLSMMTSLLYQNYVSDMETAYKLFKRDIIARIRLRAVGFDFEPEVTAKLFRLGYRVFEVPISYNPRSVEQGKKIRWTDGVVAVFTLMKFRVVPRADILQRDPVSSDAELQSTPAE